MIETLKFLFMIDCQTDFTALSGQKIVRGGNRCLSVNKYAEPFSSKVCIIDILRGEKMSRGVI